MYCNSDLSTAEVAKQVGVSRSTLYNWLEKAGVAGQRRNPTPPSDVTRLADELAEVRSALSRSVFDDRWRQVFEQLSMISELRTEIYDRRDTNLALVEGAKEAIDEHFRGQQERSQFFLSELAELRRDSEAARAERSAMSASVNRLVGLVEGLVVAMQALASAANVYRGE